MNDFIKSWLAALRGDQYIQGKGRLRTLDDHFCCVGVGQDLLNPSGWNSSDLNGYRFFDSIYPNIPEKYCASKMLLEKTGFSRRFFDDLYPLNDEVGFTFPMLADYIEGKINNGTAFK